MSIDEGCRAAVEVHCLTFQDYELNESDVSDMIADEPIRHYDGENWTCLFCLVLDDWYLDNK